MFSKAELSQLQEDLEAAGLDVEPTKYLLLCYVASVAAGVVVGIVAFVHFGLALSSLLPIVLIAFAALLLIAKKLPSQLAAARANAMLADFPIVMRALALQLTMRIPFDLALDSIASAGYSVSLEFARARREISAGMSVPEAFRRMAARIRSTLAKRAIAAIVRAYSEGGSGEGLKKVADDIAQIHRAKFREFGAKLGFMSLLFISLSCIAPMLFLTYALVGSAFLGVAVDAQTIWLAFLLAFPAANAALIVGVSAQSPCLITEAWPQFLSKEERAKANAFLAPKITVEKLLLLSVLVAVVLSLAIYYIGAGPFALAPLALPLLAYLLVLAAVERRAKEIEAALPDALFAASMLEEGVPMEKIISTLSKQRGPLAEEFAIALRQVRSGTSVVQVLQSMKERNASQLLARVLDLFVQCYRAGKKVGAILKETAEDIFEIQSIQREQSAALAMQKYTILFGGCALIPIVLAFVLQIVGSLATEGIAIRQSSGQSGGERSALIAAANDAAQIYLVIYTVLASVFVAMQEGRKRRAIIYFVAFCTLALALFNLTKIYIKL